MADPKVFKATLGHKINHDEAKDNCIFGFCVHPRFGPIRSIVTTEPIARGTELFVDYCRAPHPDDNVDDLQRKIDERLEMIKLAGEEAANSGADAAASRRGAGIQATLAQ